MKTKAVMSWSGGKDSAFALHEVLQKGEYEVVSLLTTVTEEYDRISMHGIRRQLLEAQAASLGIPLHIVYIDKSASNEHYEARMKEALDRFKEQGVTSVIFGDLFLEDLRKYREDKLATGGMSAVFPIWKFDTQELANRFIDMGFRAMISCVDSKVLDGAFSGRLYDKKLLADLPASVDPCGENGEFHSFIYDGPIFSTPVSFHKGDMTVRDERFYYCDFLPVEG